MDTKRLLNYEFLRDNVMCINELYEHTAQMVKSDLLMACHSLSCLRFADARVYVSTEGRGEYGDMVTIVIGLTSKKHAIQVHYIVSTEGHYPTSSLKRKLSVYELDVKHDTWKPVGEYVCDDTAGEVLDVLIRNIPSEFILKEDIHDEFEGICLLKDEINTIIDNKISNAADATESWIFNEFCPVLQEWLENALGRKLDINIKDAVDNTAGDMCIEEKSPMI